MSKRQKASFRNGKMRIGKHEITKQQIRILEKAGISFNTFVRSYVHLSPEELKMKFAELKMEKPLSQVVAEEVVPVVVEKEEVKEASTPWATIPMDQIPSHKKEKEAAKQFMRVPWYRKLTRKVVKN